MKKNILIAVTSLMVIAGVSSCKKMSDFEESTPTTTSTKIKEEKLLYKKWKLMEVVNISDAEKYVNTILVLDANQNYVNKKADESLITEGKWVSTTDSLFLDNGLFSLSNNDRCKITLLSETQLNLSEHHTKDGKDAILEWHYVAN